MKRLMSIIEGMAVISFLAVVTSCQEYLPFDDHDLTVQTYEKDFVSTFGIPAPNHQWGFEQQPIIDYSAGQTRVYTNPNSNEWSSVFHLNVPQAITSDEITYVKNWFSNPENTRTACEAVHFEDFFIQHVSCDRGNMSELHVKNLDGSDIHVNNFNGNSGAIMYVGQAGTEAWSYASTSSTGKFYRQWDLFYTQYLSFSVNGKEYEGWYIGFDYEFAKEGLGPESGEYNQFIFRDGVYNDWIVKVSPALHDTNSTKRVMCEDLGATADWDYNDVVFDVSFTQEGGIYYANIALRAVSGTLPIYVGKTDPAYEAHKLLGDGSLNPICETNNVATYKIKLSDLHIQDSKNVTSASANAIPVYVYGPDGIYTLTNSSIAQKLACPNTTSWAKEGIKISTVYSDFEKWVSDETVSWTENSNPSGSVQNGSLSQGGSSQAGTTLPANAVVIWEGSKCDQFQDLAYGGQNNRQGSATKSLVECLDAGLTTITIVFDGNNNNSWFQYFAAQGPNGWDKLGEMNISGSSVDIDLSSYVNKIKNENGFVVQGGYKDSKISIIKVYAH